MILSIFIGFTVFVIFGIVASHVEDRILRQKRKAQLYRRWRKSRRQH